jgi:heat shock protein HspQ
VARDCDSVLHQTQDWRGQIYKAHPLHCDTRPWYDWVMIEYFDAKKKEFFNVLHGETMFFVDLF